MSNEIDLNSFLNAAFGHHDSESGYGAQYPRSRDIRTFFEGRYGKPLPTGGVITKDFKNDCLVVQEPFRAASVALIEDLESLASQLREVLPTTE